MLVRARRLAWVTLVAAALFAPALATADDGTIDPSTRTDPAAYRGRTTRVGLVDSLLWGPRIVFFPFHLIAEYVLRKPLYAFTEWADRSHAWPILMRILHPVPDFEWSPTLSLDLGVNASAGAQMKMRNLFARGNDLQASAAGGLAVLEFDARDRSSSGPVFAGVHQHAARRVRPFFGLGPDSPDARTYFAQIRWEGGVFAGFDAGAHVHVEFSEGFRRERVGPADISPSIETRFDTATLPGFAALDLVMAAADVRIDTRRSPEHNGGVRVLANATYAQDVVVRDRSFVSMELDAEAAVEISRPDRVLSARFYGADAVPLGAAPVPLTHLSMLGWRNHLGFVWGRFRGESALMAELRYRYPIAYFTDAQLSVSAANVFARDLHDFDAGKLTTAFAAGIRTRRTGLTPIEVMFGFGTTRFDEAFSVNSVRLYIGTPEGL